VYALHPIKVQPLKERACYVKLSTLLSSRLIVDRSSDECDDEGEGEE